MPRDHLHSTAALAAALVALLPTLPHALDNGMGLTPLLATSTWNMFANGPLLNDTSIRGLADALVSTGLLAAGYSHIDVDCGWSLPERAANGSLVPDPSRFPYGMKAVADYVKSKGITFGMYTSHFLQDCCGGPGMYGHADEDAAQFVAWGVTVIKIDSCSGHARNSSSQYSDYLAAAQAFNKTGTPVYVSVCPTLYMPPDVSGCEAWGGNNSYSAYAWLAEGMDPSLVSNAVLVEFCNNANSWDAITSIIDAQADLVPAPFNDYARPGNAFDLDMLTVGCDDSPNPNTPCEGSQTYTEQRAQFSLWAIFSSPLILGSDIRVASNATLSILLNAEVIAVNQDPLMSRPVLVLDTTAHGRERVRRARALGQPRPAEVLPSLNVAVCDGSAAQAWALPGDGSIRVLGAGGECVDVYDCGTADGTVVGLFPCHLSTPACGNASSSTNQVWSGVPVMPSAPAPVTSALGTPSAPLCLDVYEWTGPVVDLWACHGTDNQDWSFNATSSALVSAHSGLCLSSAVPHETQIYAKRLQSGARAVALFNRGDSTTNITVTWAQIALGDTPWTAADVRDLWLHQDVGKGVAAQWTASVDSHEVTMLLVSQSGGGE
jgi:hypothetical protein